MITHTHARTHAHTHTHTHALTGHKQAQAVTVVIREMVAQKPRPVFCEKLKRCEKFGLRISATHTERSVDQLQQAGSLRKHGMGFTQPLGQVELQVEDAAVTG